MSMFQSMSPDFSAAYDQNRAVARGDRWGGGRIDNGFEL